jgi:hypothetical protein
MQHLYDLVPMPAGSRAFHFARRARGRCPARHPPEVGADASRRARGHDGRRSGPGRSGERTGERRSPAIAVTLSVNQAHARVTQRSPAPRRSGRESTGVYTDDLKTCARWRAGTQHAAIDPTQSHPFHYVHRPSHLGVELRRSEQSPVIIEGHPPSVEQSVEIRAQQQAVERTESLPVVRVGPRHDVRRNTQFSSCTAGHCASLPMSHNLISEATLSATGLAQVDSFGLRRIPDPAIRIGQLGIRYWFPDACQPPQPPADCRQPIGCPGFVVLSAGVTGDTCDQMPDAPVLAVRVPGRRSARRLGQLAHAGKPPRNVEVMLQHRPLATQASPDSPQRRLICADGGNRIGCDYRLQKAGRCVRQPPDSWRLARQRAGTHQ